MAPKKRKAISPNSRGLAAGKVASTAVPAETQRLCKEIEEDGGSVLAAYRDPLGGHWQVLASLPLAKVHPTPFQRDLSENHVARLTEAIDKLDRFLDPIISVRSNDAYWTPNGHHRAAAMNSLGAKSIISIVVPEEEIAFKILALNTEKAHNLRERSLEVIRMAQALADLDPRAENTFAAEFEDPALLTLGLCYDQRGRFAGSVYHSVLKKIERFLKEKLPEALAIRTERAGRMIELDDAVVRAVEALKARGFDSPYLKAFVVARINPLRFTRGKKAEFDRTIDTMLKAALRFDTSKVRMGQISGGSGPAD
ncbi:MAG: ParB N-terminal domain-containing protein [Gemmatimonadota bacterium]|nr:ParB N-terminal domain-containing protein [Gemmatimonadota bacterium]MDH5804751.1 ParB N-terminal domain-containing protein [Gemmatimonadota bacterium]